MYQRPNARGEPPRLDDVLAAQAALGAVGSSALFGAVLTGPDAALTRARCLNVPYLLD